MKWVLAVFLVVMEMLSSVNAHQATANYVANEAVLITHGDSKVLFDPFFHQAFGIYQMVPEDTKKAIFDGTSPYDNITAIVISHAHGDHFAADDVMRYLQKYPKTALVAPKQAIIELEALPQANLIKNQIHSIELEFNQQPIRLNVQGLLFEAVRIPHAGWPSRAEVENIVFRVTLSDDSSPVTVMHMGDADPDYEHYKPYNAHWQKRITDTAFPPYWFYSSAEGNHILDNMLNIRESIGIHVPVKVPKRLESSGKDYFSKPGETRNISATQEAH